MSYNGFNCSHLREDQYFPMAFLLQTVHIIEAMECYCEPPPVIGGARIQCKRCKKLKELE